MKDSIRYKIAPQMVEYDNLILDWVPYLMFFHPPNYSSNVINTCAEGFRISYKNSKPIRNGMECYKDKPVSLFIGSSLAFGVGATSDAATIPSILNGITDYNWLNFAGRAFNSTQELLIFYLNYHRFKKIDNVCIFSGINDLILYNMGTPRRGKLGNFYFQGLFEKASNTRFRELSISPKRKMLKRLLFPFLMDNIDYTTASFKDILNYCLKNRCGFDINNAYRNSSTDKKRKDDFIETLNRDIGNWGLLAKSLGIRINYILHPLASWITREPSTQEKDLFREIDSMPHSNCYKTNKSLGKEQYKWHVQILRDSCKFNGIKFFDMNKIISEQGHDNKWLFIDRFHLTDEGNRIAAQIIKDKILC